MLVTGKDISYKIANKNIFNKANFVIDDSSKIGVVGDNGSGKSTLLNIIYQLVELDDGDLFYKKNLKVSYLSQRDYFADNVTIDTLVNDFIAKNNIDRHKVESYLTKLGICDFDLLISTLSGGERKKIQISLFFSSECDLYLLDEPTNHLDISIITFLENELRRNNKALVMVTHDRYFLDRVCNKIIEVDNNLLYTYEGNYSQYLSLKKQREEMEIASINKAKSLYKTELLWMKQGVKARETKSKERIQRFNDLEQSLLAESNSSLQLEANYRRMGKKTIEFDNVTYKMNNSKILDNFTYKFNRFDRISIIGENGVGKTTFAKLIMNTISDYSGVVEIGDTITFGYFSQLFEGTKDITVKEYLDEEAVIFNYGDSILTTSQMLEKFKFNTSVLKSQIGSLSGGELKRLMLLKVLIKNPNVLILDEPTNDLDLNTLSILENYLDEFIGIVIIISHDRYFINRVCDYVFYMSGEGKIEKIDVNKFDYSKIGKKDKKAQKNTSETRSKVHKPKLTYMENKELQTIDSEIEKLELKLEEIDLKISNTTDYDDIKIILEDRNQVQTELDTKQERWMYLYEKVEEINNFKG